MKFLSERESRKLNLVCFGLNESVMDTPNERRADDFDHINSVVAKVLNLPNIVVKSPVRLGRFSQETTKPRPLRISVDSMEQKLKILERVNVRNSSLEIWKNLFIQSDLTKKQKR